MARGSAPGERRGGRKKGTPNRKTANLREMFEAEGDNPARALMRIAKAAEADGNLGLAADCWGKLAAFALPKPRPVEIDPEALCALEERLAEIRSKHSGRALQDTFGVDGLAERLQRAHKRLAAD